MVITKHIPFCNNPAELADLETFPFYLSALKHRLYVNTNFSIDHFISKITWIIHAGRHLEFSLNDVIGAKIIHVAKMATEE